MYLPPHSPDFNPTERIWLTMKARWFNFCQILVAFHFLI